MPFHDQQPGGSCEPDLKFQESKLACQCVILCYFYIQVHAVAIMYTIFTWLNAAATITHVIKLDVATI